MAESYAFTWAPPDPPPSPVCGTSTAPDMVEFWEQPPGMAQFWEPSDMKGKSMGDQLESQGQYVEALAAYKKELASKVERDGEDSLEVARTLGKIGWVCQIQGDWAQALEAYWKEHNNWVAKCGNCLEAAKVLERISSVTGGRADGGGEKPRLYCEETMNHDAGMTAQQLVEQQLLKARDEHDVDLHPEWVQVMQMQQIHKPAMEELVDLLGNWKPHGFQDEHD